MSRRRVEQSWLLPLMGVLMSACGAVVSHESIPDSESTSITRPTASPEDYPGILRTAERPLATPCGFSNGVMGISLNGGEQLTLTLDGSSRILVNGSTCSTATAANTLRINIAPALTQASDETVILDFSNGLFGTAANATQGIFISLGTGTVDSVQVLGTASADTFTFGTTAGNEYLALNTDPYRDVTLSGVENYTFSLGAGNDKFTAGGALYGVGQPVTKTVTLYGGAGNDELTGGTNADFLYGGDGDDALFESLGNDDVSGENGDDLFDEGAVVNGADILRGGAGTDTVKYSARTVNLSVTIGSGANDGAVDEFDDVRSDCEAVLGGTANDVMACEATTACTLEGNAGNDTLRGRGGNDTLRGGAGEDSLSPGAGDDVVDGGPNADTVTYDERSAAVTVVLGTGGAATTGNGSAGENDSLANLENIVGGSGNDVLTGNELDNRITGGLGNDTLTGGAGSDVFFEGAVASGSDVFNGGTGEDLVDYSARTANLTVTMDGVAANDGAAGESDDVKTDVENVSTGSGADNVTGSSGPNKIDGGAGADTLTGGDGDDQLTGGPGMDTISGGNDDDTLDAGADGATCDCGPGFDISINATTSLACEVT